MTKRISLSQAELPGLFLQSRFTCPFLPPHNKGNHQDSRAGRDGRIGDIKGGPVVGADIDVKEIDHLAETDAVNKISHRPRKDQGERKNKRKFFAPCLPEVVEDKEDRRQSDRKEKNRPERRRRPGQKTEGSACIPHVDDIEKSVDNRKAFMEPKRRNDPTLRQLIQEDHHACNRQKEKSLLPQNLPLHSITHRSSPNYHIGLLKIIPASVTEGRMSGI